MVGALNSKESLNGTVQEPLELIPEKSFTELSNILLKDAPGSLPTLGVVKNVINWRKNASIPTDQKLYAPFGAFKNGICVGIWDSDFLQACTFFTRDTKDQKLIEAFLTTNLISWGINEKRACILFEIPENLMPIVQKVAAKKNVSLDSHVTIHFWMEKEQAIKLEVKCPPGVKLGPLTLDQIPYLDQYWPHRSDHSQGFLRALLERNFGIGVYVDGNEMPVAWIVLNHVSCMVMLYTLEAHRRKGYAELVCNAMAKRLAEMDIYPRATIIESNLSSKMLFTKMGYKEGQKLHYVHLESK